MERFSEFVLHVGSSKLGEISLACIAVTDRHVVNTKFNGPRSKIKNTSFDAKGRQETGITQPRAVHPITHL